MTSKYSFSKHLKNAMVVIAIAAIAPMSQAKIFGDAKTAPQFQKPNEPIPSTTATFSWADAIARATPAVVSIQSTKEIPREMNPLLRDPFYRHFFGGDLSNLPPEVQSGIGSGVVVTKDGYILTNNHVIADADEIKVKLNDGRLVKAKVVGTDPETDVAVLKVDASNLPVIAMGDSDKTRVGDVAFAIGNPFGVGITVTQGIISATHRDDLGISAIENYIQTDAAINPGNSGGALIDANGNIVAINNAIYTRSGGFQGIGFAIPINLAKEIMADLIGQGQVIRGWLGISVFKLTDEARKSLNYPKGDGAVIAGIIRGGPAHTAGLKPGDIIISLDNKPTKGPSDVLSITSKLKPETAYPIAVIRNGETLDFRVMVGKRPVKKKAEKAPANKGALPRNEGPEQEER